MLGIRTCGNHLKCSVPIYDSSFLGNIDIVYALPFLFPANNSVVTETGRPLKALSLKASLMSLKS